MTSEEITAVETLVNQEILKGEDVITEVKTIAEAKADGAMALFGEKYGDTVRVVKMGDFSAELCGGTHLCNTAKAGLFRIVSESGVAAGVRRIEAITGMNALNAFRERDNTIEKVRATIKANSVNDIVTRAEAVQAEIKNLSKELEKANVAICSTKASAACAEAVQVGSVKLVRCCFENTPVDALRTAIDGIVSKDGDAVCVFSSVNDGKLTFASGAGKSAVGAGAHAGMLLKALSSIVGGGGGGRPDSATSGGKFVEKVGEAMEALPEILSAQLK
jgi:alanyl-tRNA synthetase